MKYIFEELVEASIVFKHINESESTPQDKAYMTATVKDIFHLLQVVDDEEQHKNTVQKLRVGFPILI
jgi:hypothetical protein